MKYYSLKINKIPIYARLANTPSTREQGLMNIDSLEPNEGCLFVFDSDQLINFWMKNCKINLQTITIDSSGRIVDILDMKYEDPYYIHKSSCPVRYVLEMSEGFFTQNKITPGDQVEFEY